MKTVVIVPAYNEEPNIRSVVTNVKRCCPQADIVVVNDGSTDRTGQVARESGATVVLDLPVNLGIGGAVQTGYLYAERNGYDIAVQLDGDGQHDAADLPLLIGRVASGEADCCIGSRFLHKTAYRSTVMRRAGIYFFSWMIRWMVGQKVTDPTSGFRAVNRDAIRLFARYYPHDYPEVEAIVLLVRRGFRISETPVHMRDRQAGKSSITPFRSLYYMFKVSLAVMMTRIRSAS